MCYLVTDKKMASKTAGKGHEDGPRTRVEAARARRAFSTLPPAPTQRSAPSDTCKLKRLPRALGKGKSKVGGGIAKKR